LVPVAFHIYIRIRIETDSNRVQCTFLLHIIRINLSSCLSRFAWAESFLIIWITFVGDLRIWIETDWDSRICTYCLFIIAIYLTSCLSWISSGKLYLLMLHSFRPWHSNRDRGWLELEHQHFLFATLGSFECIMRSGVWTRYRCGCQHHLADRFRDQIYWVWLRPGFSVMAKS
jgi:hypothetical protein